MNEMSFRGLFGNDEEHFFAVVDKTMLKSSSVDLAGLLVLSLVPGYGKSRQGIQHWNSEGWKECERNLIAIAMGGGQTVRPRDPGWGSTSRQGRGNKRRSGRFAAKRHIAEAPPHRDEELAIPLVKMLEFRDNVGPLNGKLCIGAYAMLLAHDRKEWRLQEMAEAWNMSESTTRRFAKLLVEAGGARRSLFGKYRLVVD